MRAKPGPRRLHRLQPGWTVVAVAIVAMTTIGTVAGLWRFAANGEWWNVPAVIVGSLLGYWWAAPAWRLARHVRLSAVRES